VGIQPQQVVDLRRRQAVADLDIARQGQVFSDAAAPRSLT
jgi:hypothetical protein